MILLLGSYPPQGKNGYCKLNHSENKPEYIIYSKLNEGFWDPHLQNVVAITIYSHNFKWVVDMARILHYDFSNCTEIFFQNSLLNLPEKQSHLLKKSNV